MILLDIVKNLKKTNLFKIFSQGIILNFLKVLASFGVNILVARIVGGPDFYGLIVLSITFINFLGIIVGLGIHGSLVRYSKQNYQEGKLNDYIKEITSYLYTLYFLFPFIFFLDPEFWSNLIFDSNNTNFLLFISLMLPLTSLKKLVFSIYWGFNNFKSRGIAELLPPILNLLLLGIILFFFKDPLVSSTLAMCSYIFAELLAVLYLRKRIKNDYSVDIFKYRFPDFKFSYEFKKNIKFGIWSMTAALSLIFMNLIDQININNLLSSQILGKYIVIVNLSSYLVIPVTIGSNVILSNYLDLWESNRNVVVEKLNKIYYLILSGLLIAGFLFYTLLPFVIDTIYGVEFSGLEYLFPLILVGIIMQSNYIVIGSLSSLSEKPSITTVAFIPGLIVNLIGNFVFIPIFGVIAAVITTALSFFMISVLMHFLLRINNIECSYKPIAFSTIVSVLIIVVTI